VAPETLEESALPEAAASAFDPWRAALAGVTALCCALVLISGVPTDFAQTRLGPQPVWAGTMSRGDRVNRDPVSLLQLALPLEETLGSKQVETVRNLQINIEKVRDAVRIRLWSNGISNAEAAKSLIESKRQALLKPVEAGRQAQATEVINRLEAEIPNMIGELQKGSNAGAFTDSDAELSDQVFASVKKCQNLVGDLEELMVPTGYKASIPKEILAELDPTIPLLHGRAVVEFVFKHGPDSPPNAKYAIDATIYDEAKLEIVVDGWSTPITAGNFLDLIKRGFYNGMPVQRADGFVVQTGDPGKEFDNGFMQDGKVRHIPLEVALIDKKQALYNETLDEAKMVGTPIKLPFSADGTIAMGREELEDDSASSQFFLFLFESDMTPAGKNFLDGRYSTFGYTTNGERFLRQIKQGDIVKSATIVKGEDNLEKRN